MAACAGPTDGRKEKKDPKNKDFVIVFKLFFVISGSVIFCCVLFFSELISNAGIPNSPVKIASNGSFICEFSATYPIIPDKMKIPAAISLFFW